MEKLFSELERLYFLPGQQGCTVDMDGGGKLVHSAERLLAIETLSQCFAGEASFALSLISPDGMVRVMALDFARAADWGRAASLYQALQNELDLPAPAVSVSGQKGYRLWFSLAEPVPVALAKDFLIELGRKYLAEIPAADLGRHPDGNGKSSVEAAAIMLAPARHPATGKWSAFIDPGLVGMFIDEQWLEMAPNMDRQAEMLAGLKCTEASAIERALVILQKQAEPPATVLPPEVCGKAVDPTADDDADLAGSRLNLGNHFSDPVSFLLAVMNDSSANSTQRIEAAKALLPYFAKVAGE